jgi:hypothetical protein
MSVWVSNYFQLLKLHFDEKQHLGDSLVLFLCTYIWSEILPKANHESLIGCPYWEIFREIDPRWQSLKQNLSRKHCPHGQNLLNTYDPCCKHCNSVLEYIFGKELTIGKSVLVFIWLINITWLYNYTKKKKWLFSCL